MLSISRPAMQRRPASPDCDALDTADAFAALYEQYLPMIYGYLLGFSANEEEAADLTQEVFARAFAARDRYRQQGRLVAWLRRIARNAATDAHRRRRPAVSLELMLDQARLLVEQPVEAVAVRREEHRRLAALVAQLSEDQRLLLALRFGNELTCVQIAGLVGKSEAVVKKQIERTLRRLREAYGER